mgnify:CR=1 FL=1
MTNTILNYFQKSKVTISYHQYDDFSVVLYTKLMLCTVYFIFFSCSVTDLDVNSGYVTVRCVGINDVKKPVQLEVCLL